MKFAEIVEIARAKVSDLDIIYRDRLEFEISEITKQGAERYYEELIASGRKVATNPKKLLLPWLFDIFDDKSDPIATNDLVVTTSDFEYIDDLYRQHKRLPPGMFFDDDKPDIDIDCLPYARDDIKEYAARRFGEENVASVGAWQTYLFKQAIVDVYRALGLSKAITPTNNVSDDEENNGAEDNKNKYDDEINRAFQLTKSLPDTVNDMKDGGYGKCINKIIGDDGSERECGHEHNEIKCPKCGGSDTETPTIAKLFEEFEELRKFVNDHPRHQEVIDIACKLVGKVRHAGKHAGAIIISNRNLFGEIPMRYDNKSEQWISLWSEGHSTQLSKFGYTKWDFLGLKNLQYIYECCNLITENHGISFGTGLEGFDVSDPNKDIAGYYIDQSGNRVDISLNDPGALSLANKLSLHTIFQFDTPLQFRVLSNGVRSFNDLLIYNSMGHPGPLQCCWSYSNISTENGRTYIKDLTNEKIKYLSEDGVKYTDKYRVIYSGKRRIFKIKLVDGRELFLTSDHRVLTENGYKLVRELTTNDKVKAI